MRLNSPAPAGFNLIELLITLAIIAILATLSIANYREHTEDAWQAQAHQVLLEVMQQQQSFYQVNWKYSTDLSNDLDINIEAKHYSISAHLCDSHYGGLEHCVKLTASHKHKDLSISLNSAGELTSDKKP